MFYIHIKIFIINKLKLNINNIFKIIFFNNNNLYEFHKKINNKILI